MHIAILGGSGFIGSALVKALQEQGDVVTILSRSPASTQQHRTIHYAQWNGVDAATLAPTLARKDVVVNLAGAGIADALWTDHRKQILTESRVTPTRALSSALAALNDADRPHTVIQGSAIGFYGCWGEMLAAPTCSEYATVGKGFLATLCAQWEEASDPIEALGIRRCIIRIAPVLDAHGGIMSRILPLFKAYIGGPLGSGHNPFSWIHRDDLTQAILHLIKHPHLHGIFNCSAPDKRTAKSFFKQVGKALHRPSWLPVPAFILRLTLRELAEELLLCGQVAPPERLLQAGFVFTYPTAAEALKNIVSKE